MSKLILAAAAAAALALAAPAMAQTVDAAPTQTVSTRSVNFSSPAAVKDFYAKLYQAALTVCDSGSANPRISQADISCVNQVMAQAVRAADKPVLTAMYDSANRGSAPVYAGR